MMEIPDLSNRSNAGSWLTVIGICAAAAFVSQRFLKTSRRRSWELHGKTVLITGGSRGFGLAIAEEFGSYGARLALCARDATELEAAREQLAQKGIEAHSFPADITQSSEIKPLVDRVIQQFGAIDVLVNDAGLISVGSLESFTHSDFDEAMNLMFWAPVNLTLEVYPHMQSRGGGHIVNITSVGGRVSIPHLLPYCCAKFAFVGFSTGLSTELKSKGIHVLTVVPGLMRTGSYLNAQFKGASQDEFAWFGLLGNLPGFSVAADFAAQAVRRSLENGEHVCTISLPARLLVALDALAPEASQAILELANRFALPSSTAKESQSGKTLNPALNAVFQGLTSLGRMAAQRLNEY